MQQLTPMASVVPLPFQLLLMFLLLLLLQTIAASARPNLIHPSCQPSCGNVSIPYPFGIGPGCYRDKNFRITCKENEAGVLMPYAGGNRSTVVVCNFSVPQSQATMLKHLTYDCYNTSGLMSHRRSGLGLAESPFAISAARNKFTAIGCNTIAYIEGTNASYETGCMSYCNKDDVYNNITSGSCTGTGCCQAALTENLRDYDSGFQNRSVGDDTWEYNPCSYSFVADQDWFKFNSSYLEEYNFRDKFKDGVPLVLDWIVGDVSCEEAKKNSTTYACRSSNSMCRDAPPRPWIYTCNCSEGYDGNLCLENGCEDIDECSLKDQNTPGSYNCTCNPGYQ